MEEVRHSTRRTSSIVAVGIVDENGRAVRYPRLNNESRMRSSHLAYKRPRSGNGEPEVPIGPLRASQMVIHVTDVEVVLNRGAP